MPDPVEQILLQAQAPTGKSNTGYEAFAQGRQFGQRQQQLNIEERQQALREQMAPLEAHTQMLMNTERGLDIQLKLLAKQRDIQVQSAESEAVQLMLEAGKVGYTDPSIADKMFKLYDRVPALVGTQFGKSLLDNWRLAQAQKKAQSDLQNIPREASGLPLESATIDEKTGQISPTYKRHETVAPEIRTVIDPTSGKPISLIRTGPTTWREPKGEGEEITFTSPSGEQVTMRRGGGAKQPGQLTEAGKTRNQETLSNALSALNQAERLEPIINSGTFGPAAYLENIVVDKGLANIYPELLSEDRVKARTVAAALNAATIKALRSDSNITQKELDRIIADVPDPKKILGSPKEALVQLKTINEGIIDRAVRSIRNLKQPVPDELVPRLSKFDIEPLLKEKLMTPEQALQWYKLHATQ